MQAVCEMDSNGEDSHFSHSLGGTYSVDNDPLVEDPADAVYSAITDDFEKLPTSCPSLLLVFLHVVFVVLSSVLAVFCSIMQDGLAECKTYLRDLESMTVIVFGKVVLWLLFALFERYVQFHHGRVRSLGYLHFYRSTRRLKRLPFFMHSAGNAAVLIIMSVKLSMQSEEPAYTYLLLAVLVLELLFSMPFMLTYTVKVMKFNQEQPNPDIIQQRQHLYLKHERHVITEMGFRIGSRLEDVVEKQADLIEYLKQHNTALSGRILALKCQQRRD